jgi:hypothetical protein
MAHDERTTDDAVSIEVSTAQDEQAFAHREGAFAASHLIAEASDQEPHPLQVSLLMDPSQQQTILNQFDGAVAHAPGSHGSP